MQKLRSEYLSLRRQFEPKNVTLVIVAESPPISGKYFYNPGGKVTEPLFSALMKRLDFRPQTKSEGLCEFRKRGWVLVDATYEQVNGIAESQRDRIINKDYDTLSSDLKQLLALNWRKTPLVLVKANVCRLLEPKLTDDGFYVLNKGRIVYFPSNGRQGDFAQMFSEIVPETLRAPSAGVIV